MAMSAPRENTVLVKPGKIPESVYYYSGNKTLEFPSFRRKPESTSDWMPDQVRHDELSDIWLPE